MRSIKPARTIFIAWILVGAGVVNIPSAWAGATLDKVRSMGVVVCGVNEGVPLTLCQLAVSAFYVSCLFHWSGK